MKQIKTVFLFISFLTAIYLFLVGINSLSTALTLFNAPFAKSLFLEIQNPFVGFFVGILATALMQSSSATNSLAITMVGSEIISLQQVIPIIMGANIGTTVTNTMVALGTILKTDEFKRAFAASTIHDFFNILTALILFPIELKFHLIEKSALSLYHALMSNNIKLTTPFQSPIKIAIESTSKQIHLLFSGNPSIFFLVSLGLIIAMLMLIINILKYSFLDQMKHSFKKRIFNSPFKSWSIGAFFTFIVQSSSITTSLAIPFASNGILTLEQIYPYTVGANFGTGFTTFLAALSLNRIAFVAALATILFDLISSCLIYPLPVLGSIPLWLSKKFANISSRHKIIPIIYLLILFILLPMAIILF